MFAMFTLASAHSDSQKTTKVSKDEKAILATYKEWDAALVKVDMEALDRILAEEYSFTDFDGSTADKPTMMANYKSGKDKIHSCVTSDFKMTILGDTAVVTGIWTAKMTAKGRDESGPYRFTDTWVKRNGRWQCVADHLSKLTAGK